MLQDCGGNIIRCSTRRGPRASINDSVEHRVCLSYWHAAIYRILYNFITGNMGDEFAELKAEVKRLHAKLQKVEGAQSTHRSLPFRLLTIGQTKQKSAKSTSNMATT
jgi:hypothetical protein